jgi:hypothetical protein
MRQFIVLASMLALLSACDHYEEDKAAVTVQVTEDAENIQTNYERNGMRVANGLRDNIKRTANSMRKWWIEPLPEKKRHAVASSYCYSAYQDIMCYPQPMPGWEHRLVGYQGTHAAPPPVATMQLLPARSADEKHLPQNRVAAAQPIFKEMPEENKSEDKGTVTPGEPPLAEAAHETLPDPALAPQL